MALFFCLNFRIPGITPTASMWVPFVKHLFLIKFAYQEHYHWRLPIGDVSCARMALRVARRSTPPHD